MSELTEISIQAVSLLLEVAADFCFKPNVGTSGLVIIIRVFSLRLAATDDIRRGPNSE